MSQKRFDRRVAALQKRLEAFQLFITFVKRHPVLYEYTAVGHYEGTPYLKFEERGYIKAVWHKEQDRPVLRLERHITQETNTADKVVSEDVSTLSSDELAEILKKGIRVDLSKPPFWEEGDDEV